MPPICITWPQAAEAECETEKENPSRTGKPLMKYIKFTQNIVFCSLGVALIFLKAPGGARMSGEGDLQICCL